MLNDFYRYFRMALDVGGRHWKTEEWWDGWPPNCRIKHCFRDYFIWQFESMPSTPLAYSVLKKCTTAAKQNGATSVAW